MNHEYHVMENPEGSWEIKTSRNCTGRRYGTQRDAVIAARKALSNKGGGEVVVHGRDGRIRDRDTVFASRSADSFGSP